MHCRIRLKEQLDPSWQEWLAGLTIHHEASGTTLLMGQLPDQAALHGVLATLRRLNLALLEVAVDEHAPPSLARSLKKEDGGAYGGTEKIQERMMNHTKKVLIIGCGIAGPALALFLSRAGIEAEIYEAREAPEGFALTLSCNGVAVLQELGLDRSALAAGLPVSGWEMANGQGKLLGGGTLAGGDLKSVFLKRVSLGQILSDEAERQGIPITRGKKLQSIEVDQEGRAMAIFEDETSASGDLLVGCDGIHSKVRQFVDPSCEGAVYTGLMNSGGYATHVKPPSKPETISFNFGKRAFFGYHLGANGFLYWFVNWPQTPEPARGMFEGMSDQQRRSQLLDLFRDDRPIFQEIITQADETFPFFASYALPKQPATWHRGPVALLGDAAHGISPSSGQGVAMALEDAGILAKCLRDCPEAPQAYATYEELRRERTVKMYEVGARGDSGKYIVTPVKQWFRDLTTPIFLKLFANPQASDWIYTYRIDWEKPISASCPGETPVTATHLQHTAS